jgi:hypothetical protein
MKGGEGTNKADNNLHWWIKRQNPIFLVHKYSALNSMYMRSDDITMIDWVQGNLRYMYIPKENEKEEKL